MATTTQITADESISRTASSSTRSADALDRRLFNAKVPVKLNIKDDPSYPKKSTERVIIDPVVSTEVSKIISKSDNAEIEKIVEMEKQKTIPAVFSEMNNKGLIPTREINKLRTNVSRFIYFLLNRDKNPEDSLTIDTFELCKGYQVDCVPLGLSLTFPDKAKRQAMIILCQNSGITVKEFNKSDMPRLLITEDKLSLFFSFFYKNEESQQGCQQSHHHIVLGKLTESSKNINKLQNSPGSFSPKCSDLFHKAINDLMADIHTNPLASVKLVADKLFLTFNSFAAASDCHKTLKKFYGLVLPDIKPDQKVVVLDKFDGFLGQCGLNPKKEEELKSGLFNGVASIFGFK